MKKKILSLSLFIFTISVTSFAYAKCIGNACEYISVTKKKGVIVIVNSHPKQKIVVRETTKAGKVMQFTPSVEVYASSEEVPKNIHGEERTVGFENYKADFK